MTGTAAAQAVTLLLAPVLSRLFTPAHFGLLVLFTSTIGIIAEVASGAYELAVVLPKEDDDAANVLAVSCGLVLVTALLSLIAVLIGGDWIAVRLGNAEIAPFLIWTPLSLLALGWGRTLGFWSTRRKQFRRISVSEVTRSVGAAGTQTVSGFAHVGSAGLIGGRVAGDLAASLLLAAWIWGEDRARLISAIGWRRMKEVAARYSDFPKFSLPQGLMNSVSQNVPVFLLTSLFDSGVVGYYAMAHRLLYLPSRFLGQSVRQVFLQRAAEAEAHGEQLYPLLRKATFGLVALGLAPALIVVVGGAPLFRLTLGEQWGDSGRYAAWMTLWLFFAFVNPPAMSITQVVRKQHWLLWYDGVLLIARCVALYTGAKLGGALGAVACFSVVGGVMNGGFVVWMLEYTRRRDHAEGRH
ncbi:MAG: oligosaccharide flippase family protein [Candidatus Eisenbacteria bacterium]